MPTWAPKWISGWAPDCPQGLRPRATPWRALRRYPGPIHILKAEHGALTHVPVAPRGLPNVTVEVVAGGGHLFPMTHADVARDALFEAAV